MELRWGDGGGGHMKRCGAIPRENALDFGARHFEKRITITNCVDMFCAPQRLTHAVLRGMSR